MKQIRGFCHAIGFALIVTFLACSDAIAPTPASPLVSVRTNVNQVPLERFDPDWYRITLPVTISNTSDKTIYYNSYCLFRFDRAVNGAWRPSLGQHCADVQRALTAIQSGQSVSLDLVAAGTESDYGEVPKPGTYRAHVFLFEDIAGAAALPDDAGYSRPFNVTEQ